MQKITIIINRKTGKETVIGKPFKNIVWPESVIHLVLDAIDRHLESETNKKKS